MESLQHMTLTLCETRNMFSIMSIWCLFPEMLVQMTKTKFQVKFQVRESLD